MGTVASGRGRAQSSKPGMHSLGKGNPWDLGKIHWGRPIWLRLSKSISAVQWLERLGASS